LTALFLHSSIYPLERKWRTIFLAFLFFLGLAYGLYCFINSQNMLFPLMLGSYAGSVSIVSFFASSILPFLLSAIAVSFSIPWLIYFLSFTEAFLFSFVSLLVIFSFQPVGFLIRFLFLFGDITTLPILYFFWHKYLSSNSSYLYSGIFLFLSYGCLIGCIDYCMVLPFGAKFII